MVKVEESTIEDAYRVHEFIPELNDPDDNLLNFKDRVINKKNLVIVAKLDGVEAGYLIAYDRWDDGSCYCWMTAVKPEYRNQKILTNMMNFLYEWAKAHNYRSIKIKTRNSRREMLSYLVRNDYNILQVEDKLNPKNNKILLEKALVDHPKGA